MEDLIFVYALYSKEFDRIYVGMTNNLERRLHEHNNLQNTSTKAFAPWIILFSESYSNRTLARDREKYLKSYRGRTFIRSRIEN
jgi:putative endonuclease